MERMPTSTPTTSFTAAQSHALIRSVFGIFLVNGLMIGAWGGSLPGLRERLHTDASGIGLVLLLAGGSAIVAMQVSGRVSDRFTPRLPSLVGGVGLAIGLLVVAFAPNYPTLVVGGVMIGACNGVMDVAMNALGVDAERASGTAVMSRFHAFFSLGGFLGALLVMGSAKLQGGDGADPRWALVAAAIFAGAGLTALFALTPQAPHVEDSTDDAAPISPRSGDAPPRPGIPPQAWLLGVMALFFGFTEGTAIDWASIHVTDVAHVDPGVGAAGLVCVSATMVVIRLLGDSLVARFGRAAVVRFGAPVAVAGFGVVITTSSLPLILVGWLLVGLGVGMIAPQIYAIAGHIGGGRVLAIVTAFGYTAFLAGPGIIGFLSNHFGIQRAMILPFVAGLLLTGLTFTAALRDPQES